MDFSRTFFVTTTTHKRYTYFNDLTKARHFFRVLYDYRAKGKFLVHAFVLMPDLHVILTLAIDILLEKAVQFIKGGSSFQMKLSEKLWQPSFSNHRIRDEEDYAIHVGYLARNPVKARLVDVAEKYSLCSAYPGWKLDPAPAGAKARDLSGPLTHG